MQNGKNPLMLMMALSMPGAAHALGLGDIHVDSALNERLAAEIDIVGATPTELGDLQAAVANRETFLHYGADRPNFLSSATFKVTQDSQGRPVLSVRSTEAFTEPLVNFLVDLHWRHGDLIRQYTLLLDPPGFAAVRLPEAAPAAPAASAPSLPAAPQVPGVPAAARKTTHVKVGAKATLRGIAWRVGERSPSDLQRMMIAIFRANPSAFDGNINRLHLGAVLTVPSYAEVAAISGEEAKREFHLQMAAWHPQARTMHASTSPAAVAPAAAAPVALALPASSAAADDASAPKAPETEELNKRVRSLEHELAEAQGLLESQRGKLVDMEQQVSLAEKTAPVADAQLPQDKSGHSPLVPIVGGIGLLAGALAALYFRLRRRAPKSNNLRVDTGAAPAASLADDIGGVDDTGGLQGTTPVSTQGDAGADAARRQARAEVLTEARIESHYAHHHSQADASEDDTADTLEAPAPIFNEDTHPMKALPAAAMPKRVNNAAATISRPDPADTTVNMSVATVKLPVAAHAELTRLDATHLDYNLVDLDMTAQHVQMPSVLNEHAVVNERRTNLADVLRMAIEREPDRHDLRMKLLELYYSAAATNRQGFLEVVEKFARDRDYLQTDQWDKIARMGRQIASENPLFAEQSAADDDLADCA